jgi:hypothetical protein
MHEKERVRQAVSSYRTPNNRWLKEYKESNPCSDCRNFYPYYVMDFDHRGEKMKNVSQMRSSPLWKIKEEVAKCDLVCANCHRHRTHERGYSSRPIAGLV